MAFNRVRVFSAVRTGAVAHSNIVKKLRYPSKEKRVSILKEIRRSKGLSPKQKALLSKTVGRIWNNYISSELAEKVLDANTVFSVLAKKAGLKTRKPFSSAILKRTPFGFLLVLDKRSFSALSAGRVKQKTAINRRAAAVTTTLTISVPGKKERIVPVTFAPIGVSVGSLKHELSHRRGYALEPSPEWLRKEDLSTRANARGFVEDFVRGEFVAYLSSREMDLFGSHLKAFFTKNERLVRESFSKNEVRSMLDALLLVNRRAVAKIPSSELISILETTPVNKWKQRLSGVLKYT